MRHLIKCTLLFVCLLILSISCKRANENPAIMVTIEPLRYFTEKIVGDTYRVVSMVPNGSSPETYDPTPQQLIEFSNSIAYIKIGYIGFELNWMKKLSQMAPTLKIYDSSVGLNLITGDGHFHGEHFHGGVEPHTWNSPNNARIIAKNILNAVVELNPKDAELYRENYNKLLEIIDQTDAEARKVLSKPSAAQGFMIYHPALSYFARDYNLIQVSIEEDGKEPTPAHLKELINTCRDKEIKIIFIQPEFDKKNAEVISQEVNGRIVPINPLSYDWSDEIIRTANVLSNN